MEFDIKEYFNALNLADWKITGNMGKGGQANTIEVKNIKSGELGVFRTLNRKESKDIERFYRELEILKKTNHPNIIGLLDYTKTKEHQWYISKKGKRFETYWREFILQNENKPDVILAEAVRIIENLADGLVDLHNQGVIHRDIKASNIVVIDNIPKLIDFGIAFVSGEERLTSPDEAVANRLSPDLALSFIENVPAWLDVFLLSQLFIWMISEGVTKSNFQRPLDWRWVVYPNFSDKMNVIRAKALTGLCSNFFTSPKDANEFKKLLKSLFKQPESNLNEEISLTLAAIEKGKASKLLAYSETRSIIESRLPLFVVIAKELEKGIKNLVEELQKQKIKINENTKKHIDDLVADFNKLEELPSSYGANYSYTIGDGKDIFGIGFSYHIYLKKAVENTLKLKPFENIPTISFTLAGSNEKLAQKGKVRSYIAALNSNGVLNLHNGTDYSFIKEITVNEIVEMVRKSITDPEVWEIIYE